LKIFIVEKRKRKNGAKRYTTYEIKFYDGVECSFLKVMLYKMSFDIGWSSLLGISSP